MALGPVLSYAAAQDNAYEDIRDSVMKTNPEMSEEEVTRFAIDWAPAAAVPVALLERVQVGALLGISPDSPARSIPSRTGSPTRRCATDSARVVPPPRKP
ncbi:MAG: hypothetical protein EOP88_26540 [Verrucomicrobiaceae bacterium]|nr:MAG: hypothetical protein EOP88_26540 [Verrucomicrobiaceae bacterium]